MFLALVWSTGEGIFLNAKREGEIKYQAVAISGQSIEEVYFSRVRHKLATILNDSVHNLYSDSSRMEGSGRLRISLARTNRLKVSFVPSAISGFNRRFEFK